MSKSFAIQVELDVDYPQAIEKVTAALKDEGFGILTEIDVRETLQEKLGEDFRRYAILGACNPPLAHRALQSEPLVGLMLPCNVTVEETARGSLVSILNPQAMLRFEMLEEDDQIPQVANEAAERLERVAEALRG